MAAGLSAIGLYGVGAYGVAPRTSEIAIRMALGANRRNILRMTLGETARLVAIGIAAAVAITLAGARLVDSLLFGTGRELEAMRVLTHI